jgi:hypothetical protein
MGSWVHGFMGSWFMVHGSWVHEFMGSWVHAHPRDEAVWKLRNPKSRRPARAGKRGAFETGLSDRTRPEIIGHPGHRRTATPSHRVEYGTILPGPATYILDKTRPLSRFPLGPLIQVRRWMV